MLKVTRSLAAGLLAASAGLAAFSQAGEAPSGTLGLFTHHADIGQVQHAGTARHDSATGGYLVSGGGGNMWFTNDACHFVWKPMSGDLALAADIRWPTPGGNAHRKACLILRQTTSPDAPYADAVLHGDGLTSLQYREEPGGPTREIQANLTAPRRLRIEKRGDYVSMSVARPGEPLAPAGGSFCLKLREPFLVGLAVCAHDNDRLETAEFANVTLEPLTSAPGARPVLHSTLETVTIASQDRRVVWHTTNHIEAPNWSRDGAHLLVNGGGLLYRIPVAGGAPVRLDTGFATRCNNDHGYSPDGQWLAISDQSQGDRTSLIYVLPAAGGAPRLVTRLGPSYWHGWSPDGRQLAYCAERGGEYDIYTISYEPGVKGHPENRDVMLRLLPLGGGEVRVLAKLFGGQGTINVPSWSPDSRRLALVSYQLIVP